VALVFLWCGGSGNHIVEFHFFLSDLGFNHAFLLDQTCEFLVDMVDLLVAFAV